MAFLYFELTRSQQMCLVVTSFKQAKPCLGSLEGAGPWSGGIGLVGAKFLYDPWRSSAPRGEVSWRCLVLLVLGFHVFHQPWTSLSCPCVAWGWWLLAGGVPGG